MKFFLGLQIHQSPHGIFINQAKYTLEILHKHGMDKGQSIGTPMATKPKLYADLSGNPVDQTDYRSKIGSLIYLTSSRPDIVQAVCFYARYQSRPTEKHLKEVKRIFRYLRGTANMGLWYLKGSSFVLTAFLDADHAGCIDSHKSTSEGIQFLGDKLVSWMLKKQNCTAMSSTEDEYVALSASCAQVIWMRTQLQDYGFNYNKISLYCDSQSAIFAKKSDSQNMAFISSAKNSIRNGDVNTASIPTASTQIKYGDINQIDEDDIEEMDIKWNMALLSMGANRYWKKTGKKIYIQGTDVAGFDKSKVECFNCHNMGHFARWDWSYMENEEENHALVADEEAPTEFALMAKSRLSQVKSRIVEFKNQEIKFCEKIRGLEFKCCPPPPAQVYSPPKKDMSWTGLPEFADDTITDYTRPSPSIESNLNDLQNNSSFVSENGESTSSILSKPEIKFVKASDSPIVIKTNKDETVRKTCVKYAEMYRKTSKSSNVRGNHRNWNNLKSQQLGKNFLMKNKACFNYGDFDHLSYDCGKWVDQGKTWQSELKLKFQEFPLSIENFPLLTENFPLGNSQNNIDNKGYWDIGCSRHMTGNISYLSDYEPYDGGYVSFGQGGCKITECIVLGRNFKLKDDTNVLLRTPRQHNMYLIDLNNVIPHKDLAYLVAKASADECMLWHKRLGHLNFKTMNKLVRHNLHKASCKTKLVNLVTKPLHTLHMDLFGPTSVSSLNHKWYCLVVTDDFFRLTWTFLLKTKDETNGILRNFITEIENLKDLKVKIIRCDNGGEFRNKEMNDFCSKKGIKREFSNARTSQQNGVAERRNKTLIEAARTMLVDAKFPVTFWAEAVNTACYVQNRVLVNKSQNKTPYELFNGRSPAIGFLKPFRCHVMILNTLDHLGKFKAKGDEGTTSTNFLGTKEAASQDVKKDVSSLRYIALPNWFHEAHLESSTSNAQDACKANAPESSRNFNPTATLTNSPADQMETLIVKTLIPTVSSPVLTACLDDSPQLSNILGVTTNTDDSNGVEADLGNMEYNISASPTPTFRIHKDHPKSQIIGPMDTPVQTRTKSKEIEEQSFIATIHQKTDPALL
nr:putative ribonuclease H-like domain-containing protein [Tanacetum cinerariifolium]